MVSVRPNRPRRLAVQTIEEGQIGIETRLVERSIHRGDRERVFTIVEVAKFDSSGAHIARRVGHHDVLDLWPPDPFESDRIAAARHDGLRDRGDQRHSVKSLNDRRKRNLNDDRQDVTELYGVRLRVEGEFARKVGAEGGLDIHEEGVADQPRKDAHTLVLEWVSKSEARLAPI